MTQQAEQQVEQQTEQQTPQAAQQPATVTIEKEVVVYEPTGNASLDFALKYLGKQGIGPEHPAIQAAQRGEFSALDTLAQERKFDAEVLALGKQGYEALQGANKARQEAFLGTLNGVAKAAGLEDWAAVKTFVAKEATAEELAEINGVLGRGGVAAKLLAESLAARARAVPATKDGRPVAKPGAVPATQGTAMTATEYSKQVAKLRATHGYNYSNTKEFVSLQSQRLAAIRAGIR